MKHWIGAGLGWGAQDHRTQGGPKALFESAEFQKLRGSFEPLTHLEQSEFSPQGSSLDRVGRFNQVLGAHVGKACRQGHFPVIIGGDHSIAAGTWSALQSAQPEEPLGLLWIDAHMDAHTPETSETSAVHGMPLAALLGYGDSGLTGFASQDPRLLPQNVILFGVRSFEDGEAQLVQELGIRIYFMEEIFERGLFVCLQEAFFRLGQSTSRYGVTLDLDVFDPRACPGIGSPVSGGLDPREFIQAWQNCWMPPGLAGFELVEYNPELDQDGASKNIAISCLEVICNWTENEFAKTRSFAKSRQDTLYRASI